MYNIEALKNEVSTWVENAFNLSPKKYQYHNWEHTQNVCRAVRNICKESSISAEDKEDLELAAIFHDVGFVKQRIDHEEVGAQMAKAFLSKANFPSRRISNIESIILATKLGHRPTNSLEEIIQDADLAHLGSSKYLKNTYKNLFKEISENDFPNLNKAKWKEMCLEFFRKHKFYSAYAKTHFDPIKKQNIQAIMELETTEKKGKSKKSKVDLPEKGIETLFRVSLRNHVNLSRIADNKANTLISINAIIISVVLSALFPNLDSNPNLLYPGIFLLFVNIITIFISILSVIPKTTHGKMTKEEVLNKKGNLIFFGNFHSMKLEDFEWGINQLMSDKDYLYKSLTRDLFFLGKVLNKKYQFLRISYYVFLIGLIISISLFIISFYGKIAL